MRAQRVMQASLSLHAGGDGLYRLDFTLGDMAFSGAKGDCVGLEADGMVGLAPREGMPMLPQMSRLLALPRGAELRVEGWQAVEAGLLPLPEGKVLSPWQGAAVKDAGERRVLPEKASYAADSFVRWGNPVEVESLGVMGDRQLFRVTVRPVAYNPVAGEVAVSSRISATLITENLQLSAAGTSLTQRYLIVSRPQFRDGLQPFVQWKRQEGFEVEEIYVDTNRRDTVKTVIDDAFGDGERTPWPRYILLVGDAAMIQAYVGTTRPTGLNTHPTDLYYADFTGDYLPDALLGRWPVNDTAELRAVVEKTLRYERGLDADTAVLRRVLLVAGRENSEPAPTTTNGQVNYLKRAFAQEGFDTLCYYNPASSGQRTEILSDMGRGVGLLNYTAHCTASGWSNPAVTFGSVDTIESPMPLFYVNNCCQSNNFTGTCFGEQLLRKPQGGGVAVIGATNSTLWNEDFYWAVGPKYPITLDPQYDSLRPGAFDRLLGGEIYTAGELLVAGNLAVTAFGSPYDRFYWEIYTLFGDPSLAPYLGVSDRVTLSVPDTIAVGTMELRVSGTEGALVTAVQGGELLGVVRLDNHRSSLLRLHRATDTMPVVFTATLAGMLPTEIVAPTAMPHGKAVAFTEATIGEYNAGFTVVNVGTDTVYGLTVTLAEADSGSMYASFTAGTITFAMLPPGASQTVDYLPLHLDRWAPYMSAMLTATDADGDYWRLTLCEQMYDMWPHLMFNVRHADTTLATALQAGNDYLVGATPEGYYDTLHIGVTSLPDGAVFENNGGWLPVAVGDSATQLRLTGHIGRGNYSRDYEYYAVVGAKIDGFGNGMDAYPWQSSGTLPWTVDSTVSHSGRYSLRSGAIDYRQTSVLTIEVFPVTDDSIAFWVRTSTEPNYDKLQFSINGVKAFERWGETAWRRYAYLLRAGCRYTLSWRYSKDESHSEGSDCVWLDDVRLPFALWSGPCGAGAADDGTENVVESEPFKANVYPNPSSGRVTVTASSRIETLRLIDLYGRVVFTAEPLSAVVTLDFGSFPCGLYIVELHSADGTSHTKLNLQNR